MYQAVKRAVLPNFGGYIHSLKEIGALNPSLALGFACQKRVHPASVDNYGLGISGWYVLESGSDLLGPCFIDHMLSFFIVPLPP